MNTVNWKKLSWWVGVLVLIAVLAAPELAAEQRSVSATIDETFDFNGETFGPGKLTVREVSHYNPGTTMTEVWVDGRCLGLMLADVSSEPVTSRSGDRMLFERDAKGGLVLVGFAYRNQPAREFYGYETAAAGGRWSSPAARFAEGVAIVLH